MRRQRWRVVDLRPYGGSTVVTLVGLGPMNDGDRRQVVTPFDLVEPVARPSRRRVVSMREWRRRCRALVVEHGPASMLRTALGARIELLPHQLEPALAVVRGLASRVLVADEVGLGKTIQAGLVISELMARGAADRVLILAPAGLREQWAHELRDRFHLEPTVVDMREARRRMATLPVGLNPWSTVPIVVASIDYVKRPEVRPAVVSCRWDVVVIDEAHEVGQGSDRFEAASALCRLTPHVLLLTATPHSGDRQAFLSLCRLGAREGDRLLAFRRSRRDCALNTRRHVHRLLVRPSADEMRMHAMLAEFAHAVYSERGDRDRDCWLALAILHKRALSSARSLEQSVRRRLALLSSCSDEPVHQPFLPLDDGNGELDASDDMPAWTARALNDLGGERRLLESIARAAEKAASGETKVAALARLLARLRRRAEQAIVFTEYRDTLLRLQNALPFPCALLHGGLSREVRRSVLQDFTAGRASILLATDAAGEGLNLHHNCRVVINLELPWNPVRLEQRAGRVDRIGQGRPVHVFYLIARETAETRILQRLKERVALAHQDIDAADPLGPDPADEHEEEIVTRLIIAGDTSIESTASLTPGIAAPEPILEEHFQVVRLIGEAAVEHSRLVQARAFLEPLRHGGILNAEDEVVAIAKRPNVRSMLASRVLVIVRSTLEDTAGRIVARHLTPMMVVVLSALHRNRLRAGMDALLASLRLHELKTLDSSQRQWHADSIRDHRQFWATRLAREHAIAASGPRDEATAFQPGLFDRRAERAWHAGHDHFQEAADEAFRHVAAAERSGFVGAPEPGVALILIP